MIIFLYGPNSYSRHKKMREIIDDRAAAKAKLSNMLVDRFDFGNENEYSRFEDFISLRSMFSSKKIGILENVFPAYAKTSSGKEVKKKFLDISEDKDTLLIIISDTKPPASFSFLLEKNQDKSLISQNFPDIKKGEELINFIQKEALSRGLNLSEDEIFLMQEIFGSDIWAIATELDKLALMEKRELPRRANADYFKTLNSFKNGKSVRDRILSLETLLSDRGDEPAKIFNMIGFGYSTKELIDKLADYDVIIKSGKLDYEEALLDLALS